jgi:uncharacterized phage protein (TIGR02220 family)
MIVARINKLEDMLSDNISVCQRGLLVTILLVRESNPKMTWAKFKAIVNVKEHREDLVDLYEKNYIEWSGYKDSKKHLETVRDTSREQGIITFMNGVYGRNFSTKTSKTMSLLSSLLGKYSEEDIKLVISNRYLEWKDEPMMSKHLNPSTVFRLANFEKYLEEAIHTRVGESIVAVKQIGLNVGDFIGEEHLDSLQPKHAYKVTVYKDDNYLNKQVMYGKDLRQAIRKSLKRGQENLTYKYTGE